MYRICMKQKPPVFHASCSNSITNSYISVANIFQGIKFERISFIFCLILFTFAGLWIAQMLVAIVFNPFLFSKHEAIIGISRSFL